MKKTKIIKHPEKQSLRLNKYISDAGFSSRREADRIIASGRVTVDGITAEVGMQVYPNQTVLIDGKPISIKEERVYLILNKPKGVICTNDLAVSGNIRQFVNYKELIFPVGRLDKDSTGIILLTNDGDIVNKILRVEYGHEKEYLVTVNKVVTKDFIEKMEAGVLIYNPVVHKDHLTNPCKIVQVSHYSFKITINQGLNRQIRRMCEALGYHVASLQRIRIMHLRIGNLALGEYRHLTAEELTKLDQLIYKR